MKKQRMEITQGFFKSRFEKISFYVVFILFTGMVIGLDGVSGVYFYSSVNNIFIYYIPLICAVFWVAMGVKGFIRLYGNPEAIKLSMDRAGRFGKKHQNLWPLYWIFCILFLCVSVGPLVSFMLWNNAKLLSKVISYQQYEQVVELQWIGVNNHRRRHMLKVTFRKENEVMKVDIKRDIMKFNGYGNIADAIEVNKMVCIKGYEAPWGIVVNQVNRPAECKK